MSKIKLEAPFRAFRGKICKHSDIIYKKMGETQFTSQICNPRTKPYSAAEIARQVKFKNIQQQVDAILQDNELLEPYAVAFSKQTKYTRLRGYIFAELYAQP